MIASALLVSGCKDNTSTKERVNSNIRTYIGHASKDVVTDTDFDGKYDVLETIVAGKGRKLFFKKGYSPGRDPGCEVEFVDEDFFRYYDKELFKDVVKKYYGAEMKDE